MSTTRPEPAKADSEQTSKSKTDAPQQKPAKSAAPPPPRRWPLRLFLLLLLAGAGIGGYAWYQREHEPRDQSRLVLEGNIDVRQVNLAFKVDGRIATLAVDEGDSVRAGQVIATLDKRYFEDDLRLIRARRDNVAANLARLEHGSRPEEIAEARASVAERKATLARAQQDFERAKNLVGKGAVSQETFDQAKAALDESEARLANAEQALHLAVIGPRKEDIDAARAQLAGEDASLIQSDRRLSDADLIAPNDGIILTRAREKGAIVAAGEPVFTLTLSTPVWVRTYVNEQDLGRIEPDMPGDVRTDSTPDKIYRGRIGFISPTAEFTPKTVETRELRTDLVYRLRVLVDNPDGGLRQGMPVTVTLDLDRSSANHQPGDERNQKEGPAKKSDTSLDQKLDKGASPNPGS
jgi:HlyD family secretion protein